jgi:hypothetical protein
MKIIGWLLLLLIPLAVSGQEAIMPRPSPVAIVTARFKDTYLKITYSQPSKRNRPVFGALVPYDAVWRTGANEATELTVTRDCKFNGSNLKAGTYSLFTIPRPDRWTIIINADLGLWGSYNYNEKQDVLRIEVPTEPVTDAVFESFTIQLIQKNDKADLCFVWDRTKVIVPIQFQDPKL